MEVDQILNEARSKKNDNKRLTRKLKKVNSKSLDADVSRQHTLVFEKLDCLQCANCCKTTSPRLFQSDIDRMAKAVKMKSSDFTDQYIKVDEDGDYVFHSIPCPFLGNDNYCEIYNSRPRACREYPHTDRKRFHQVLNLTLKNTEICPAVCKIFDGLREKYL